MILRLHQIAEAVIHHVLFKACNLMKNVRLIVFVALLCILPTCCTDENEETDMPETQSSDFVTPTQILQFALHDLKLGMSKSEVESKIGVGIVTTNGSSFVYDMNDTTMLELIYDQAGAVSSARIIADQRIKYELKY